MPRLHPISLWLLECFLRFIDPYHYRLKNYLKIEYGITKFKFPLQKLPLLAISEVVKSMTVQERVKLAVTSRKMEKAVKFVKSESHVYEIWLVDGRFSLYIWKGIRKEWMRIYDSVQYSSVGFKNYLSFPEIEPWLCSKNSHLENVTQLFERLRQIIPCQKLGLYLSADEFTKRIAIDLFSDPVINQYDSVNVIWKNAQLSTLKIIMYFADKSREFCVWSFLRKNFNHEMAFSFSSVYYQYAEWVKLRHLCSLRNIQNVSLWKNLFTAQDMKTFINFWRNNDYNMFRTLRIGFKMGNELELREILRDVLVVETFRFGQRLFLTASKSPSNREHKILSISYNHRRLRLHTYTPDEPYKYFSLIGKPFSKEFEILGVLNQKMELEKELNKLETLAVA